jgi:hypothetical protein
MTGNERLAHLAQVLREVPAERFDLGDWSTRVEDPCSFAGCAVGWATQDPVLRAEGLGMRDGFPRFEGTMVDYGWDAVQEFFDLTHADAYSMFGLNSYDSPAPRPDTVAARITEFLEHS